MQVCIADGISTAYELAKSIIQKESTTPLQEKNLNLALSLILNFSMG